MEFALTPDRRRLYAVGPCFYTGGLSSVSLTSGRVRLLARPGNRRGVCGTRLAVGKDERVVIARTAQASPAARQPGDLLLVDGHSGRVLRRIRLPAEPADVLVG